MTHMGMFNVKESLLCSSSLTNLMMTGHFQVLMFKRWFEAPLSYLSLGQPKLRCWSNFRNMSFWSIGIKYNTVSGCDVPRDMPLPVHQQMDVLYPPVVGIVQPFGEVLLQVWLEVLVWLLTLNITRERLTQTVDNIDSITSRIFILREVRVNICSILMPHTLSCCLSSLNVKK